MDSATKKLLLQRIHHVTFSPKKMGLSNSKQSICMWATKQICSWAYICVYIMGYLYIIKQCTTIAGICGTKNFLLSLMDSYYIFFYRFLLVHFRGAQGICRSTSALVSSQSSSLSALQHCFHDSNENIER